MNARSNPTQRAAECGARFRRILVCLDRSESAEAVVPLATYLARAHGGSLAFLHVLDGPPNLAEARATDALEWEILRQETRSYLQQFVDEAAEQGIDAQSRLVEGAAAQSVIRTAESLGADLVVIATHGGGAGFAPTFDLGGTAQKILALAQVPTLIVPVSLDAPETRVPPERVFVPLDGSLRGECVLPTAIGLARQADAEVVLAHVTTDPARTELLFAEEDLMQARALADRLTERAHEYLDRIRGQLEASGARASATTARSVDPREELMSRAAAAQADLIVLSAHGTTCNPRRNYGSVTAHVVTHSMIPILVIQDLPARNLAESSGASSRPPPRSSNAAATEG